MKKTNIIAIFTIVLALTCSFLQAQPVNSKVRSSRDPWQFGIKASGSYDKVSIKSKSEMKLGYKAGFVAEKHLVYMLYFQPSLQFTQKGYKYEIPFGFRDEVYFSMLEIDAGLLMKFGDERLKRGMFLSLTPFVTKALSVNWTQTNINSANPEYNQTTTSNSLEYLNTLDIGFKLGIGYDFNRHWEIAANYTFGLNRISVYNNHKWRGVNLNLIYFF